MLYTACLLGLQQGGTVYAHCPNMELHQSGGHGHRHPISVEELVQMSGSSWLRTWIVILFQWGGSGSYGASFKVTCAAYSYTVVGLRNNIATLEGGVTQGRDLPCSSACTPYRGLRFQSSLEGLTRPKFISCTVLAWLNSLLPSTHACSLHGDQRR